MAARHIRAVAERQVPRGFVVRPAAGVRIEQRVEPLRRVGCYVPGGRYPLPSTLLMMVMMATLVGTIVLLPIYMQTVMGLSTQTAGAQANFTVSPEQLRINQKISSAAVKRSPVR